MSDRKLSSELLGQCADMVLTGNRTEAEKLARQVLDQELSILGAIENGFSVGIRQAGEKWEQGEYFLPELAFAAEAMKGAMAILEPALLDSEAQSRSRGTVVIGTVQGDIHDIGKSLVATMLLANGFRVIDLGADVAHTHFIEAVQEYEPTILGMSALLTTTMAGQREVIGLLAENGLRDEIKVIVGGAPASARWARDIGADGYADNAVEAVALAGKLTGGDGAPGCADG